LLQTSQPNIIHHTDKKQRSEKKKQRKKKKQEECENMEQEAGKAITDCLHALLEVP
jgi:hypothetical protein